MKLDGLSLRAKLLLTTVITVLLAFSVTLGVLALRSHEAVLEQGMARAEQVTATTVRDIEARLALAMNTANTLARTLEGLHDNGMRDRFVVNETLRQVLAGEPDLLGRIPVGSRMHSTARTVTTQVRRVRKHPGASCRTGTGWATIWRWKP